MPEPFPLSEESLPIRLRELLKPVGNSPDLRVEVACLQESGAYEANAEHLYLQMTVVPEQNHTFVEVLSEVSNGSVTFSVPAGDVKGSSSGFTPSISRRFPMLRTNLSFLLSNNKNSSNN
ncbi:hypothetical protein [Psychromonas sp.]|uniref:hypothetical protein n=1 Tax=Psychromonas sp. TaxID=1884585 RepID=UPI003A970954